MKSSERELMVVFSRYVVVVFLLAVFAIPLLTMSASDNDAGQDSVGCTFFGWLVKPLGFCKVQVDSGSLQDSEVVQDVSVNAVDDSAEPRTEVVVEDTPPIIQEVTNEYVTVVNNNSSLDGGNQELLSQVSLLVAGLSQDLDGRFVTSSLLENELTDLRDFIDKQADKTAENAGDSIKNLTIDGVFTTPSLSGAVVQDFLSFTDSSPAITTNKLYSQSGSLFWNGSPISGSSTVLWSTDGSDVYRTAGSVGIGTTTPTEELEVVGTIKATELEAEVYDTGGAVCNVKAYGAVGDNATNDYDAIMQAIGDCGEGGTVLFPPGEYRINQPIVLDTPVTLRGSYSPRWSYSSTPRSSIRANFGAFVGNSLIHVRDRTISGEVNHNNGGRLINLTIDGGSFGANVHGVHFEGLVRDWKLIDVDISQTTGNGFLAEVGAGEGNPRGFTIRGLSIYSADGHGFRATALNDSYLEDVLTVGNALRGFYLSSMGETKVNNSRAVFNALEGLYIDGSSNNGGLMFTDFSTDRNDRHGVRISSNGTTTTTFNGLLTRRDGANLGGGSETPYAGVAIIGSSTTSVAPVIINGLSQIIGVDDNGVGPVAPLVGVRATNAEYVRVNGQLWGVNEAFRDDGGNDWFIVEDESIVKTGEDWTDQEAPLHFSKWQKINDGLLYDDGLVNIGSATGTRLLNLTSASNAGVRMTDTTNDVIFDMRAEDFQGFFGTFSNHQLRFQTNNNSRLTIDTNGNVGIGTTSPLELLHVSGGSILLDNNINLEWLNTNGVAVPVMRLSAGNGTIINTPAGSDINFQSGGSTMMIVKDSGNIGIGTTTPDSILHLDNGASENTIHFTESGQDRAFVGVVGTDGQIVPSSLDNDFAIRSGFNIRFGAGGYADSVIIDTSGNVAIGTTTPGANLSIYSDTAQDAFSVRANNGDVWSIDQFGGFTSSYGQGFAYDTNITEYAVLAYSDLYITAGASGGTGNIILSANNGDVAIGTNNVTSELTVSGDIRVGNSGTNGCIEGYDGATLTGSCSSDERLKTDIENLGEDGEILAGLLELDPVTYSWNELAEEKFQKNTATVIAGLIAQDVEESFPELVTYDDEGYRQVKFQSLQFYIIQAIKDMWQVVTGIEEKVQEIDDLKQRIEVLEEALDIEYEEPVLEPEQDEEAFVEEDTATTTLDISETENGESVATSTATFSTEVNEASVESEDEQEVSADVDLENIPVEQEEEVETEEGEEQEEGEVDSSSSSPEEDALTEEDTEV